MNAVSNSSRGGQLAFILVALILAAGIAACGYFVSRTLYNSQIAVNTAQAKGLDITNYSLSYSFTQINDIKPDMLKEAAQNARIAATEFARNAGASVGKIRSANQGGFIVEDASAGQSGNSSLMQQVRVVTTIDFYLTD